MTWFSMNPEVEKEFEATWTLYKHLQAPNVALEL